MFFKKVTDRLGTIPVTLKADTMVTMETQEVLTEAELLMGGTDLVVTDLLIENDGRSQPRLY